MRIIPAIDIIDGKCVRLSKGDYSTAKMYDENPLEVAKRFEAAGLKYVHLVDLDGAKSKRIINQKVLETIATRTCLKVDFGGGLKTDSDVRIAFDSGANQITAGSIAASNPNAVLEWVKRYGAERIILGADCRNGRIATQGWSNETQWDVIDFIQSYSESGIRSVISTDIEKDGMLQGPSFELYAKILRETNVHPIASGGIQSVDDLKRLRDLGCEGAIVGKAIYEGRITLKELVELC